MNPFHALPSYFLKILLLLLLLLFSSCLQVGLPSGLFSSCFLTRFPYGLFFLSFVPHNLSTSFLSICLPQYIVSTAVHHTMFPVYFQFLPHQPHNLRQRPLSKPHSLFFFPRCCDRLCFKYEINNRQTCDSILVFMF